MRDTGRILKRVPGGFGQLYSAHLVERAGAGADLVGLRVEAAGLFLVPDAADELEGEATKWVRGRLTALQAEIRNTTGATRDGYRRVEEMTSTPEEGILELRDNTVAATLGADGQVLPTFPGHLYADDAGQFPADFSSSGWELQVVDAELARPSFVAWFRNPSRATPAALRIAYQGDGGNWTSVQPDFVVVSRRTDGSLGAAIVDPHGDYMADARPKLVALTRYAEQFGHRFVRIESISEVDGELRLLDLLDAAVRQAVLGFAGAQVAALYASDLGRPYR